MRRLQQLIRALALAVGRLMYPRVLLIGRPPGGPLLLAPNHPNGLLDGLVLLLALERPVAFLAKSTFFANPLLRLVLEAFDAVPVFRPGDLGKPGGPAVGAPETNDASFAACRALLRRGGMLAVFPEGTSNPGPALLPLRTGAARIALGAEAEAGWSLELALLPVGLWFEDQTRPRSAALALIGRPIPAVELYELYERDRHAAVVALNERLRVELEWATGRARRAGRLLIRLRGSKSQRSRASRRGAGMAYTAARAVGLAFGAPVALFGLLLALPGLALARLFLALLALRHRATVGTVRLVSLALGLALGWSITALAIGILFGMGWALAGLALGPALGYAALRWCETLCYTGGR